jgi:hypothetical protein
MLFIKFVQFGSNLASMTLTLMLYILHKPTILGFQLWIVDVENNSKLCLISQNFHLFEMFYASGLVMVGNTFFGER